MTSKKPHRLELTLHRPLLSWRSKPTVVIGGLGQPAQWGVGTWQLPQLSEHGEASGMLRIFVFNRAWRYGVADFVFDGNPPAALDYHPPLLPFGRGKLRVRH